MKPNESPFYKDLAAQPLVSGQGLPNTYNNVLTVRYRDLEEISLRQEMFDLMSGFDYGEPKENIFVVKKLVRNREGVPIQCPCWNNLQNEGQASCPYCQGIGYQNHEDMFLGFIFDIKGKRTNDVYGYKAPLGRDVQVTHNFFTSFDIKINDGDYILRPILNDEGFVDYPLAFDQKFIVKHTFVNRLDEGRLEYLYCDLTEIE